MELVAVGLSLLVIVFVSGAALIMFYWLFGLLVTKLFNLE